MNTVPPVHLASLMLLLLLHALHFFINAALARKLLLHLLNHKPFVVLQTLLHMDLELDDIIQHLFDLRMQLFSQRIRP